LLRLERDDDKWGDLMLPVVVLLEDLFLVGDFDAAEGLLKVVVGATTPSASIARRQRALIAIDTLVAGSMLRHVTAHLATIDDKQFQRVKAMCVSIGEVLVRPLADALSAEERGRARERLTAILIAFGNVARRTAENLKNSPKAAVRRTAIYLLREFGGTGALPDLTELLGDNEPQVQREAVHAILNIGTDQAYRVLQQALVSGTAHSREAIMKSLSGTRDERATPLFIYILRHVDHRGKLALVYLRTIESLGALRDPAGITPLKEALHKGEWWSPARTRALRAAAAAALARIGTPEGYAALEEAAIQGSRGVRAAARAQLKSLRRQPAPRTGAA
jgi:HEAT repeat protein